MPRVKVGDTVYIIFKNNIIKTRVYMTGVDSFCHIDCFNPLFIDEYRVPIRFVDEGTVWFRSLYLAKRYLLKQKPDLVIHKIDSDYWEGYFNL